jgi:hypothetical protein
LETSAFDQVKSVLYFGKMRLIVSGLDLAPVRFDHLWARYILGFKPWTHCAKCFESKEATAVRPTMNDGEYDLSDDHQFLYLCGVGKSDTKRAGPDFARKVTNVHLAVRPRRGSVASIGSVYGVTFTIKDAQAIPINPLPENFQGLQPAHYRCKNFQFGYQTFDANKVGQHSPHEIVRKLRES